MASKNGSESVAPATPLKKVRRSKVFPTGIMVNEFAILPSTVALSDESYTVPKRIQDLDKSPIQKK